MNENKINLKIDDGLYETHSHKKYATKKKYSLHDPKKISAFIPGTIIDVFISPGKTVKEGEKLLVLEAMKMHNIITSHTAGKVKSVTVRKGDMVPKGQLLVELE
ncbi:MAG: acetyl-CoA carboxylase biotin carboxyl carrier protein subunit [Ignavibacteriales bacterium]|nr:acetyl-CoA carboxylase biotin carboxyl carrier protein subunit [Ignavibacteriales bacterium]